MIFKFSLDHFPNDRRIKDEIFVAMDGSEQSLPTVDSGKGLPRTDSDVILYPS